MLSPLPRRTRGVLVVPPYSRPDVRASVFHGGGLPPWTTGSASASFVSRLTRRSLTLRPACSLSRLERPFDIGSLSRFVTSSPVPTATGWNNQFPGRDSHPLENSAFPRRTVRDSFCGFPSAPKGRHRIAGANGPGREAPRIVGALKGRKNDAHGFRVFRPFRACVMDETHLPGAAPPAILVCRACLAARG